MTTPVHTPLSFHRSSSEKIEIITEGVTDLTPHRHHSKARGHYNFGAGCAALAMLAMPETARPTSCTGCQAQRSPTALSGRSSAARLIT